MTIVILREGKDSAVRQSVPETGDDDAVRCLRDRRHHTGALNQATLSKQVHLDEVPGPSSLLIGLFLDSSSRSLCLGA
jgi:hypothetical protein